MYIFFIVIGNLFAQSSALVTNIHNRKTISLNGSWYIIIDPYENGYYDYRYQPKISGGYFENKKPQSKSDLIEYDFDNSDVLQVPGDWNSQRDGLFFYEGTIWYNKSFEYVKQQGKRLFVYFGAANYDAKVFLNGKKLGEHEGGFTPFDFEITDLVQDKGNFLIVKVDNKRRRDAVPTLNTDWWNYGGLTREVLLVEIPQTFIRGYFVQLEKHSRKKITGWIQLDGSKPGQQVKISIPKAGTKVTTTTNKDGFAGFSLDASLELWSPENPKLYAVAIEAETDNIKEQIGFRAIETRGTKISLNGQSIFTGNFPLDSD